MAVTCSIRSVRSSRFSVLRGSPPKFPETFAAASGLFSASGYAQETGPDRLRLGSWACSLRSTVPPPLALRQFASFGVTSPKPPRRTNPAAKAGHGRRSTGKAGARNWKERREPNGFRDSCYGRRSCRQRPTREDSQVCWERSVETLRARKDDIAGLAIASDERIEAYLLY